MKIYKKFLFMISVAFILLFSFMVLYKLGDGYLISTDEAYHATNAYEMYKQGNWIINSYRYAVDYFNSKPPLCLDMMIISYKILGVSVFSARFPSAIGGILTCILITIFLYRKKSVYSAAIFPLLFASCTELITFHMYRAAEMDSLFNLFFSVAMIALYYMENNYDYMYLYMICVGLAFMCKGPHAAQIVVIGLLFVPKIKEAFLPVKKVIVSIGLAIIIPVLWIIKRLLFDGTRLFESLFVGEVAERVESADQSFWMPITNFLLSNIFVTFVVLLGVVIIFAVFAASKDDLEKKLALKFLNENYLFILWALVPVILFAIAHSYLAWYTYSSRIAMSILVANLFGLFAEKIVKENPWKISILLGIVTAISLVSIVPCITKNIILAGTGGHKVDQFTSEMEEFAEQYGDDYAGINAYLLSSFRIHSDQGHWEPEYVAPAEMYSDLMPVDGDIDNFLNDDEAIIIVDKDLWEQYQDVLTGHVILQDNSYLIFSTEMY